MLDIEISEDIDVSFHCEGSLEHGGETWAHVRVSEIVTQSDLETPTTDLIVTTLPLGGVGGQQIRISVPFEQ
jgi:hypothetical protein